MSRVNRVKLELKELEKSLEISNDLLTRLNPKVVTLEVILPQKMPIILRLSNIFESDP